jgi:rhodanese-related sulfurtransferase
MKGFVHIPLGQLQHRMSELPKNATIVTACSHGVRAARAAALLEKAGYTTIGYCGMAE